MSWHLDLARPCLSITLKAVLSSQLHRPPSFGYDVCREQTRLRINAPCSLAHCLVAQSRRTASAAVTLLRHIHYISHCIYYNTRCTVENYISFCNTRSEWSCFWHINSRTPIRAWESRRRGERLLINILLILENRYRHQDFLRYNYGPALNSPEHTYTYIRFQKV